MSMPTHSVGLPKVVNYELLPSLSDNANHRFVNIAPNGITQTATVGISATPYVANSGGPLMPFTQQLISFDIPCPNSGFSQFIDPTSTTINFRLIWNVSIAQAAGTGAGTYALPQMNIISSFASFISSITLLSNNTVLETINNYDLICHLLLHSTLNLAQRQANGWQLGADANSESGIDLCTAVAGIYYFNVSLPLLSIIDVNGGDKLFPISLLSNLQLQILTNQFMPISTSCATVPTTMPVATVTLDTWSLSLKYIDLVEQAGNLLSQSIKDGKIYLKASSYLNTNTTIPVNSSGSQSILLQIRNSSVKSFYTMIGSQGLPLLCPNFLYDSINPNITSRQLANPANGFLMPQRPLNPSQRPAETMNHYMMAWGSGPASSYGGVVGSECFHTLYPAGPVGSGYYTRMVVPANAIRTPYTNDDNVAYNVIQKFLNAFYLGFDTEKCPTSLFSGISTRTSAPQYNMVLNQATGATLQITTFGLIDVVACCDVETRSVVIYN